MTREPLKMFKTDRRGVAAVEFALIAVFLTVATVNVADIANFTYKSMQVGNAAQMGAQAAWKACDETKLPATVKCTGLTTTITAAAQSTSLGTGVVLAANSPSEGYYCINSTNALQYVSAVSVKPANCAAAGSPTLSPGDYLTVTVTHPYGSLVPGLSVGSLFPTTIAKTAFLRMI